MRKRTKRFSEELGPMKIHIKNETILKHQPKKAITIRTSYTFTMYLIDNASLFNGKINNEKKIMCIWKYLQKRLN